MKTLKEIIKQESVYLNDWSSKFSVIADFEDVYMSKEDFEATESTYPNEAYWLENKTKMSNALKRYKDINILFASYGNANYTGDAWVLFEKDGKLYEVNGSHCSCHGLEEQWCPEEVVLAELENRLVNGTFGEDDWSDNTFKKELCEFLDVPFKLNQKD